MNVVLSASVLPRTPADIYGMLSVVFIGPGKFDPECLGPMFKIQKQKVWVFLLWLKQHNQIYLVEWAIAAHGMYESLIFNQFLFQMT